MINNCTVTFQENNQKIILEFTDADGEFTYVPKFDPPVDMKSYVGMAGFLCDTLLTALHEKYGKQD